MSDATKAIITACITAGATLVVAVLSLLTAYLAGKRERRRLLYSEAIRAAVGWNEMLYRVRRRAAGQEPELITAFHDLQDRLSYYQAWVGSESKAMQRSFAKLVAGAKDRTGSLITAAWDDEIRDVPGNAKPTDDHPDLDDLTAAFSADVRSHLSPWPWRKVAVIWRNRTKNNA